MTESDQFRLGQMEQRLNNNDERHRTNIEHLEKIDTTLKQLVEAITLVKGGVRTLYTIGAFGAVIGAGVTSAVHWFIGHIK